MTELTIGKTYKLKAWEEIPTEVKGGEARDPRRITRRRGMHCGKEVKIVDCAIFPAWGGAKAYYFEVGGAECAAPLTADYFEEVSPPDPVTYETVVSDAGDVVVINMYRVQGDKRELLARAHAHKLYEGDYGYVQAVSYAAHRAFKGAREEGGDED